MDIATLIGLVSAFGLVGYAIAAGVGIAAFIDTQSLLIVVGGTIGATFINYPLAQVLGAGKVAKNAFLYKIINPKDVITQMIDFSNRARREGILALEEVVGDTDNAFLKKGIQLAVDGEDPQAIENILDTEISWLKDRHRIGAEIFSTMGAFAPALGLIGTLVGLVGMLQNMDDPSTIGPSMAVALLTTFYGALFANLLFNPLAGKLRTRSSEEVLVWELTREGVLAISAGDNPRMVEQRLSAFLAPKFRETQED
ncbi:MAG: MotA/TolQ/ExbB proton channel family protein [Myxococcota bacterium]|nr:MotA/TolQ/ExbB proton channel family protein [Myxococcota bacterium]